MSKLNDPQAAQYALLVMYVEDMYNALADPNKASHFPPIDPRISKDWNVIGFITAVDALFDSQNLGLGDRFFYGFLACNIAEPTQYVAVIRGTANASEWIEDVEFVSIPAPAPPRMAGRVENGFFSIYESMEYTSFLPDGLAGTQSVVTGISADVGQHSLTVIGHSLGSSLATFLTLDLAVSNLFKGKLSACVFASPHTGDAEFAAYFDQKVKNYKVYNYSRDIVPKVPLAFGYTHLPKALEFSPEDANAVIKSSLAGNHHAVCYAAMIDYSAAHWRVMPAIDKECAACIIGPNP